MYSHIRIGDFMITPNYNEIDLLHNHMCKAIGSPTRILILYALNEQPRNVTSLAEALDTPQPTISRHLALLKQRGIVTSKRDGASVIYQMADRRIVEALDLMRQVLHQSVAAKQASLSLMTESDEL